MRFCDYLNLLIHLKHRFEGFIIHYTLQRMVDVPEVMNELLLECGTIALLDGVHHTYVLGDNVYTIVHPLVITALDAEGEAACTDIVDVVATGVLLDELPILQLIEEIVEAGVSVGQLDELIESDHILLLLQHIAEEREKRLQKAGIIGIHDHAGLQNLTKIAYLSHTIHIDAAHEAATLWLRVQCTFCVQLSHRLSNGDTATAEHLCQLHFTELRARLKFQGRDATPQIMMDFLWLRYGRSICRRFKWMNLLWLRNRRGICR